MTTTIGSSGPGCISAQTAVGNTIVNIHQPPPPPPPTNDEDLFLDLKAKLEREYKTIQTPTLPWLEGRIALPLDKIFIDLEMHKRDSRGREETRVSIELKDIFTEWNDQFTNLQPEKHKKVGKKPVHILVEGGPGFGKTTLAHKLAQDWAKGVEYMTNFDLVVLLQLRRFKGSLQSVLGNALTLVDHTKEVILKEVGKRNSLLILDGYDELSDENTEALKPLLKKETFRNMSLAVISRPGKTTDFNDCFDMRYTIRGISEERRNQFLANYFKAFDPRKAEVLMAKLETFRLKNNLLKCPLILLLVVLLAQECDVKRLRTKTDVYKHFFNFIVQRGLQKIGKTNEKIDLFQDWDCCKKSWWNVFLSWFGKREQRPFYVNLMDRFGELAFKSLLTKQTTFTESEILAYFDEKDNTILHLDFFTPNESVNGILKEWCYEPVHLTFLEFGAALHFWLSRHRLEKKYLKLEVVGLFSDHWISVSENPELMFFGEMLGNEDHLLVRVLRMCHDESVKTDWFFNHAYLLNGLQTTTDILSELDYFIPENWRVGRDTFFNKSLLHRKIVSRGIRSGKVKTIEWDISYEANIPKEEVQLETLTLTVHKDANRFANTTGEKIRCRHLKCEVYSDEEKTYEELAVVLKTINFDYISFLCYDVQIYRVWLPLLHKETKNEQLGLQPIKVTCCQLQYGDIQNSTYFKAVANLVIENKMSEPELETCRISNNLESNFIVEFETVRNILSPEALLDLWK